ncbi:hypothetical protein PUN28_014445 [Cardiocondyla obscurior]|uniref:Uncharacterized protein n=1 Tax=Cardiocondyla obscurior TaxID=286306 RepID=A0AAW2F2B7_9HYME
MQGLVFRRRRSLIKFNYPRKRSGERERKREAEGKQNVEDAGKGEGEMEGTQGQSFFRRLTFPLNRISSPELEPRNVLSRYRCLEADFAILHLQRGEIFPRALARSQFEAVRGGSHGNGGVPQVGDGRGKSGNYASSGLPIAIGFNHELSQPCDILPAAPLGRRQVDRPGKREEKRDGWVADTLIVKLTADYGRRSKSAAFSEFTAGGSARPPRRGRLPGRPPRPGITIFDAEVSINTETTNVVDANAFRSILGKNDSARPGPRGNTSL